MLMSDSIAIHCELNVFCVLHVKSAICVTDSVGWFHDSYDALLEGQL